MTSSASPPGPGHSDELAAAAAVRRRGIGLVDGATVITDHLGHTVTEARSSSAKRFVVVAVDARSAGDRPGRAAARGLASRA